MNNLRSGVRLCMVLSYGDVHIRRTYCPCYADWSMIRNPAYAIPWYMYWDRLLIKRDAWRRFVQT
ncbi:hypothetical protein D3C87_2104670 [compost metagenome]